MTPTPVEEAVSRTGTQRSPVLHADPGWGVTPPPRHCR